MPIPYVIEKTPKGEDRVYDLFSRLLMERYVFISGVVNSKMADVIVAELLFLQKEDPSKPITIYIDSPGGDISAGFAIIDALNHISCPIITVASGLCASMGALILMCGDKGKRYSQPNASILIHQPLMSGVQGQASDIEIVANEILRNKESIEKLISEKTGQSKEEVKKATDRDNWMTPNEALSFGIIDSILPTGKKADGNINSKLNK